MILTFLFLLACIPAERIILQDKQSIIVDGDFSNRPFGQILLPENIDTVLKMKFKIEKRPIVNNHSGETDSLLIYRNNESEFYFYKSASKTFLQRALITDPHIKLSRKIEVGKSVNFFKTAFKINGAITNPVTITDEENYSQHRFFFSRGKLVKIEMNSGFD